MIREKVKNYICKVNIWQLLFAMMFSAMLTASRHTFDLRADRDTVDTVFITDFHLIDCVIWIAAAVIVYIALKGLMYVFASAASRFFTHNTGGGLSAAYICGAFFDDHVAAVSAFILSGRHFLRYRRFNRYGSL